jgi:non-canonical (house-cleaning) NTP pyrophosphatase
MSHHVDSSPPSVRSIEPLVIIVTSENPDKRAGVLRALTEADPAPPFSLFMVPVDVGPLGEQPVGMQQILDCARARIRGAKGSVEDEPAGLIVSIVSGLICLVNSGGTDAIDICCVVIEDIQTHQQTYAFSESRSGLSFPLSRIQQMHMLARPTTTVPWCCENYYPDRKLPVSRQDQVHAVTKMALAEFGYMFIKK